MTQTQPSNTQETSNNSLVDKMLTGTRQGRTRSGGMPADDFASTIPKNEKLNKDETRLSIFLGHAHNRLSRTRAVAI